MIWVGFSSQLVLIFTFVALYDHNPPMLPMDGQTDRHHACRKALLQLTDAIKLNPVLLKQEIA